MIQIAAIGTEPAETIAADRAWSRAGRGGTETPFDLIEFGDERRGQRLVFVGAQFAEVAFNLNVA